MRGFAPSTRGASRIPASAGLIEALLEASPTFRQLWPLHEVMAEQAGSKVTEHPELGRLAMTLVQSAPTSYPDLRLTQFVAADEATRRALESATG